jgi:hypothetical protein
LLRAGFLSPPCTDALFLDKKFFTPISWHILMISNKNVRPVESWIAASSGIAAASPSSAPPSASAADSVMGSASMYSSIFAQNFSSKSAN